MDVLRLLLLALTACGRFGFQTEHVDGVSPDSGANQIPIDAAPGTILPPCIADTYVQGIDTTPNGANIDLQCGRSSGSGNNLYTLFWFDLSAATTPVTTATLRLYQYSSVGTISLNFQVYRITQTWDEATADWDHASSGVTWPIGGAVDPTVYVTMPVQLGSYGYYDWDVTTLVNEWITGTQPNYGLELQYDVQPPTGSVAVFASREHPTVAWRPQLLLAP